MGIVQLVFGPLSDKIGRRKLIIIGMLIQGTRVVSFIGFSTFYGFITASILTGLGTATDIDQSKIKKIYLNIALFNH